MGLEQKLIQDKIDGGELITMCCGFETVKTASGNYVGFRFEEPYKNISHGFSPEYYEILMSALEYRRTLK